MNGQLVTVKEQAGEAPNGTAFTITTAPSPELDATNLVVGRVVEGLEVVARITQVGGPAGWCWEGQFGGLQAAG
jgi:peptidyl-prolyl cis-trans isomerase B (cyclophilin B)